VVICLQRGADCLHMVQLMPLHPQTPSSLASFKSRLVLSFWYQLTWVVLEKRPLNGCSGSGSSCGPGGVVVRCVCVWTVTVEPNDFWPGMLVLLDLSVLCTNVWVMCH